MRDTLTHSDSAASTRRPHSMQITTAPPDFDRWNELHTLLSAAFADMDGRIDPPSSLDRMDADALRRKADSETLILAHAGGRLIGCAFAAPRADHVYVGKVAVAAEARRSGVARALFAAADAVARRHGCGELELQTRIELTENHRCFSALGFRVVAETAHPGYDRPTSLTMRREVPAAPQAPAAGA